jgi:hypothetical protein
VTSRELARVLRNIYRNSLDPQKLLELVQVLGPLADELDASGPWHSETEVRSLRDKIAELYDRLDAVSRPR